ncbi:aminoacylase-1-like [Maniola hyperantus]|uniref:aminoacylase-1-like n=1 Tax=Aphantopus hyperantus TaxID=2795564 RepID=UPI00374A3E69
MVILTQLGGWSVVVHLSICRIISEFHNELEEYKTNPAVQRLQEYIQIDTSIEENIKHAANFWKRQAAELGLPFAERRPAGLPICVITIKGAKPELPSIMLNSHADVVPTEADLWTYPPFAAHIDDKGHLFGRGAQDCKSTGVQYLEAIRKLQQQNITLDRTVYNITVMPDEETGGFKGMVPFVKTEEFKSMNVGFALDEGVPSPSDVYTYAMYTDKRPWQMKFEIHGEGGHGSLLSEESTIDQAQTLINTAMAYRNQQLEIKKTRAETDYGAYNSLNINMLQCGIATNVSPSRMSAVVDVRLGVEEKVSDFQTTVNSWMAKLGNNTKLEFIRRINSSEATTVDDSNQYWVAMRDTLGNLGVTVLPIVCPGTTDMLEIRALGIPAIGFTPNRNLPIKAHGVDEFVSMKTYLEGIEMYAVLIKRLANLPAFT